MRLERLNESGTIRRAGPQGLCRFEYDSRFYGGCTFVGKIVERREGLLLDGCSIVWEDHRLNNGNLSTLQRSAEVFFNQGLRGYDSVAQFQEMLRRSQQKGVFSWLGSALNWGRTVRQVGLDLEN